MSISNFASVPLFELNASAELLERVDRKYPLHHCAAEMFLEQLPQGTRILEINGRQHFGYTSVYFDTPGRDAYLLAARGRAHRFKVRVRQYQDSGDTFLEVKTRQGRSTVKQRIPHESRSLHQIAPSEYAFIRACLEEGGIHGLQPSSLRPSLETNYIRSTFLSPDGRTRLTLDQDIAWRENGRALRMPRLAIIETKAGTAPCEADRRLWHHGHRPQRISKYATGLALLHPELPSNRWHRTLKHHLTLRSTTEKR